MSEDIKSQLIEKEKTAFFALQPDESTILLVGLNLWCMFDIVRKMKYFKILYFANYMPIRTTGEKVF